MTETVAKNLEKTNSATEIFEKISLLEPKPIAGFVPDDADEQRELFFTGKIRNPVHKYSKLETLNPLKDAEQIQAYGAEFADILDSNSTEFMAYSQYVDRYIAMHHMLQAAKDTHSEDPALAEAAKIQFMELNERLYGSPDEATYRSLLHDILNIPVTKETAYIKEELLALLPESSAAAERFKPSVETIAQMQEITEYLYGGMLEHIPADKESFSPQEVADIFQTITTDEFGEAAEGWKVIVTKATSVNVDANEKTIKIPENREDLSQTEIRGLVAHEIGVHMLRSITGGETNLPVLSTGLSNYYDAEEGLGKVMEQAVNGQYVESGVPYYLIAGLMHFDKKDYRDTFDIMYRMKYLEAVNEGKPADEATMGNAQEAADNALFRITRGTDSLPWFKDLAYYNGSAKMWEYCEKTTGDYEGFMLTLLGKADPTLAEHRRTLLETKSL